MNVIIVIPVKNILFILLIKFIIYCVYIFMLFMKSSLHLPSAEIGYILLKQSVYKPVGFGCKLSASSSTSTSTSFGAARASVKFCSGKEDEEEKKLEKNIG